MAFVSQPGTPPKPQRAAVQPFRVQPQRGAAPPVYNPFRQTRTVQQTPARKAPPVYNPYKQASALQQKPASVAPPVYRPQRAPMQPAFRAASTVCRPAAAHPLSRPASVRQAVSQCKPAQHPAATCIPSPNAAPPKSKQVVQRLVYLISEDSTAQGTYRNLTTLPPNHTDPTGSLRAVPDDNSPFADLGLNESLHIIVHGGGGTVDGMTPAKFAERLVARGLDPDKHRGVIRLVSCFSGTPDDMGNTFIAQFAQEMRGRGFSNQFIGFNGLVRAASGGKILVVPPEKAAEFFKLSQMKKMLEEDGQLLELDKPSKGAGKDEFERFFQKAEDWKKKFKMVVDKLAALWVPQSLKTNIVLIPEVKPSDLARGNHQQQYMVGMNMISGNESIQSPHN